MDTAIKLASDIFVEVSKKLSQQDIKVCELVDLICHLIHRKKCSILDKSLETEKVFFLALV